MYIATFKQHLDNDCIYLNWCNIPELVFFISTKSTGLITWATRRVPHRGAWIAHSFWVHLQFEWDSSWRIFKFLSSRFFLSFFFQKLYFQYRYRFSKNSICLLKSFYNVQSSKHKFGFYFRHLFCCCFLEHGMNQSSLSKVNMYAILDCIWWYYIKAIKLYQRIPL